MNEKWRKDGDFVHNKLLALNACELELSIFANSFLNSFCWFSPTRQSIKVNFSFVFQVSFMYGTFGSRWYRFLSMYLWLSSKINYDARIHIFTSTNLNILIRFADFVGIGLKRTEMVCVRHVGSLIQIILHILNLYQKTSIKINGTRFFIGYFFI